LVKKPEQLTLYDLYASSPTMDKLSNFILFIAVLLLSLSLTLTFVTADSTNDSYINCTLTTINPNRNSVYNELMPLNINMAWSTSNYPYVLFLWFNASYSIDNGQKISIAQGNNPYFNSSGFAPQYEFTLGMLPAPNNPTTTSIAITIDVSSLADGAHTLTMHADGEYNEDNLFQRPYHFASSPIYFLIGYLATSPTATPSPTPSPTNNPTPTPSPTVPEFSWLTILPLLILILSFVVLIRKRKWASGNCYGNDKKE
jgi:hypothetical protein